MRSTRPAIFVVLPIILFAACAKKDLPVPEPKAASAAPPPSPKQSVTACTMITAAEMSAILGAKVTAEPNEGTADQTECIYKSVSGISPYVEFTVVRGDGESAMTAASFMSAKQPGITNPYEGIGDQAFAIGPALMIRTGEDLVKIIFSGVTDAPAAARKIFDTAKPRM